MRYGSVCSGIEAATVAWHPLGWKPAFFSEIDNFPRAVLQHHYPSVPCHGDFTTIRKDTYDPIDLLVGGTPCQAFSVAGLRQGFADERGNLTLEFIRLAQRLQPRWLVWENVPGVLSQDKGRAFAAFLGGLAECGYGFAYRVLDAQHFGVPQRRRRVFVVGYLGDWRPPAAVLFERESLLGDITPSRQKGQIVTGSLASRTSAGGGLGTDFECDGGLIASTLTARCAKGVDSDCTDTLVTHSLRGEGFDASEDGTGRGTPLVPVAFAQNTRDEVRLIGGDGYSVGALAAQPGMKQQSYLAIPIQDKATRHQGGGDGRKDDGSANGFGVGEPGDPYPTIGAHDIHAVACFKGGQGAAAGGIGYDQHVSPTLGAADSGSNRAPTLLRRMQVRRVTPRECERLQGFSDDYTLIPFRGKPAADGNRYKALGNSMAVPCMRWLGERIKLVDELQLALGA
ncbi:DNA (cytosine-5-)-methyltransferase [Zavarzinella formosa]|uniref:DNA (cytosine-5-)-methyltransferase n=1 Tax=Zavarzinella formosa TaxID=360055 RepID=UPI0002EFFE5A|nr:DNA (cytosine-5-)-methyltransferase [Zavarzinella formosa]